MVEVTLKVHLISGKMTLTGVKHILVSVSPIYFDAFFTLRQNVA